MLKPDVVVSLMTCLQKFHINIDLSIGSTVFKVNKMSAYSNI